MRLGLPLMAERMPSTWSQVPSSLRNRRSASALSLTAHPPPEEPHFVCVFGLDHFKKIGIGKRRGLPAKQVQKRREAYRIFGGRGDVQRNEVLRILGQQSVSLLAF